MGLFSPKEKKSVMEKQPELSVVESIFNLPTAYQREVASNVETLNALAGLPVNYATEVYKNIKSPQDLANRVTAAVKGSASAFTGIGDLAVMAANTARRMALKGEDWKTALHKSAGLITEAAGLNEPPKNTPEYTAYKAAQLVTPIPVKGFMKAPVSSTLTQAVPNVGVDLAISSLPPEYAGLAAAGLLTTAGAGTAYRNRYIDTFTEGKAIPTIDPNRPLSVGQQTGSETAIRAEEALRQSVNTASKVREFDKAQADSFMTRINGLLPKTKSSDTEVSKKAFDGLNTLYRSLNTQVQKKADDLFSRFYNTVGGENASLISSAPVINRIDDIIKSYAPTAISNKENAAVIDHLEKVKASLLKEDGTPRNLTAYETAQQWSDYSKKSKHGENLIENTSAKTAEVVSSRLANAYETSINDLASQLKNSNKNDAANALLFAKDEYRKDMTHLGDIKALTVNSLFDVKSASALNGRDIIEAITKYSPEDRKRMITLLNAAEPEIANNVRATMFKKLVGENAYIKGAPEKAPQFDINEVYKNYQTTLRKTPEDLEFLFPLKKDRDAFEAAMNDAKLQANVKLAQTMTDSREISKAVGAGAMLGTGKTLGKTATSSIGELLESGKRILVGEQDLFNHLFKGVDIKSNFINKVSAPLLKEVGTKAAQAGSVNRPEDQPSDDELFKQYLQQQQQPSEAPQTAPQGIPQPTEQPVQPTGIPTGSTTPLPSGLPTQAPQQDSMQPSDDELFAMYMKQKQQGQTNQEQGTQPAPMKIEIPFNKSGLQ